MVSKLRMLVGISVVCAVALIFSIAFKFPVVMFLKYEPKAAIITLGGFVFGPATCFFSSVIVCLLEMFLVGETGIFGFVMNVLSTFCFSFVASIVCFKKISFVRVLLGLLFASAFSVVGSLGVCYFVVPLFLKVSNLELICLLVNVFLPFNLLKSLLNSIIVGLLIKPLILQLRRFFKF